MTLQESEPGLENEFMAIWETQGPIAAIGWLAFRVVKGVDTRHLLSSLVPQEKFPKLESDED